MDDPSGLEGVGGNDASGADPMTSWADQFNTYEEACIYYGADTPAQCEAEARYEAEIEAIEAQDDLEARGGAYALPPLFVTYSDDIPF
jgi:hypothetical protein